MPGGRLSGLRCPRTEAVALAEAKVFTWCEKRLDELLQEHREQPVP